MFFKLIATNFEKLKENMLRKIISYGRYLYFLQMKMLRVTFPTVYDIIKHRITIPGKMMSECNEEELYLTVYVTCTYKVEASFRSTPIIFTRLTKLTIGI